MSNIIDIKSKTQSKLDEYSSEVYLYFTAGLDLINRANLFVEDKFSAIYDLKNSCNQMLNVKTKLDEIEEAFFAEVKE